MELSDLQRHWDRFGSDDPLWAILTAPDKKNNKWDPAEFFQTGCDEIQGVMQYLASLNQHPNRNSSQARAMDFGCGVGRLTQAMCEHFARCDGVDIAPSMIDGARRFNRFGDRCQYHINGKSDLTLFPDGAFDFIYSNIVLQHMEPRYSQGYVREFIRLLSPGGVAVFQLPSQRQRSEVGAPLPGEAFRAELRPGDRSLVMTAGRAATVTVRVRNASPVLWPAGNSPTPEYQVRMANHWLDAAGHLLQNDDARAALPSDVAPGGEVDLPLVVHAPKQPGDYLLELDMVQEAVAWFKDRGSPTVRIKTQVLPAPLSASPRWTALARAAGSLDQEEEAKMEMHPVDRKAIELLVADADAQMVEVQEHESAVPGYISCRYCVTR